MRKDFSGLSLSTITLQSPSAIWAVERLKLVVTETVTSNWRFDRDGPQTRKLRSPCALPHRNWQVGPAHSHNFMLISDNSAIGAIEAVDGEMSVMGRVIWIGRLM